MKDENLIQELQLNLNPGKKEFVNMNHKTPYSVDTPATQLATQAEGSWQNKSIVVAEIPVSNTQLQYIAQGKLCMLSAKGETFGVRFLMKNSFKSSKSNYVVRNMMMQVVALGKDNVMRKEDIATDIKVQTVTKTKEIAKKKIKEEIKFKTKNESKELF